MSNLTSNGQITTRDLREKLLRPSHFIPDVINDADFLEDLVVTFPDKIDDPIYVAVGESARFHNVSLTTTLTLQSSLSLSIPAWVDQLFVFAVSTAQMTNSSGSDQSIIIRTGFDGEEPPDGQQQEMQTADIGSVTHVQTFATAGVAGATVTVDVWAKCSPGTNSANSGEVNAVVVGTR